MIKKDFINQLMNKYNIEDTDKNFAKIDSKITRIINSNENLKEYYSKLETIRIGKGNNKVFDENIMNLIERQIKDYLLKINNINQKEHSEIETLLSLKNHDNKALFDLFINFGINQPTITGTAQIDRNERLKLFIEALFYSQFEFDETSYVVDLIKFENFKNDEKAEINEEITQVITKLKDPVKYYIKKK